MKYTNYLINGTIFDFEKFISEKKYFKEASQLVIAPISVVALFGCMMLLPFAISYDTYRNVKCFFIVNTKDSHLISDMKETNEKIISNFKDKSIFIKNNINDFHNILN